MATGDIQQHRDGHFVISRSVHKNTIDRIEQMERETGLSKSKIVAAVLGLYFGISPVERDESVDAT